MGQAPYLINKNWFKIYYIIKLYYFLPNIAVPDTINPKVNRYLQDGDFFAMNDPKGHNNKYTALYIKKSIPIKSGLFLYSSYK